MLASGLPVAVRILVWLIVLVPLGIFIWRRIQGVPMRGGPRTPTDGPGPTASAEVPTAPPTPIFPAAGAPANPSLGAPPPGAPLPGGLPPGDAPPDPGLASEPTGGSAPPPGPGLAPTASRSGFFAPATDRPESSADAPVPSPSVGRQTVAEALQGIVMPCDLSPVVDGSSSLPNPFRVSFLTTAAAAPEVGRALADELERLGFTLSTAAATELLARRDGTELRVVLYPTASSAKRGLEQLFPAAGPGAVGVELST